MKVSSQVVEAIFMDHRGSLDTLLSIFRYFFGTLGCQLNHNNAIERYFRHSAIGRRNWLHTGGHESAQNIAFMFGFFESCKLNNVDFGHYIEDILTRIVNGEAIDESFIPCNYVPRPFEEEAVA